MASARALVDQRCLITGGSGTLGRALGIAFAREGAKVGFTFRTNATGADATREAIVHAGGEPPVTCCGDVTDAAHAEAAVAAVVERWGGLDILVNSAAITQVLPFALVEEGDWDRVLAVNVKGAYLFARAALRPMIRQRNGRILNIGGFGRGRALPSPVHYAASKGALAGMTDALAREVARHGILVNLIDPGILDSGLGRSAPASRLAEYLEQHPAQRFGTPEEVARAAVWLVSPANTFVTGAQLALDGGI